MQPDAIRNLTNPNGLTLQDHPVINNYIVLSPPVNPSYYQDRVNIGTITPVNPQLAQMQNILQQMSNIVQQMSGITPYNGANVSQSDQLNNLLAQTYNETGQLYGQSGLSNDAIDPQLRSLLDMAYGAITDTNQFMNSMNGGQSQQYGVPQQQQQQMYQQPVVPGQRYTLPNGTEYGKGSSPGYRYQYPNGYEVPIDPSSVLGQVLNNNNPYSVSNGPSEYDQKVAKKASRILRGALKENPSEVVNVLNQLSPAQRALTERQYAEDFGSGDYTKLRHDINSALKGISKVNATELLDQGINVDPIAHAIALKDAVEHQPYADADRIKALLNVSNPEFMQASMKYYDAISPDVSLEDALKNANYKSVKDKRDILRTLADPDRELSTSTTKNMNRITDSELDNTDEKDKQIAELAAENIYKYSFSSYEQPKVTEMMNKLSPEQLALTEILYGQKYGEGDYSKLRKDLENNSNTEGLKKLNEIASSNPSSAAIAIKSALDKQTNWFNKADADSIKSILNNMSEEEIAQMVNEYNTISPDKTLTAYIKEQRFESDSDKEKILQVIQQAVYRNGSGKVNL